ncbi:MAG TPA: ergothioneine biosynthesis protein EgtB [Prochlorococcus sp.]|jgi:ergothioneine biosynthesis protein EgtB|nr:ergothioneine biosynthesis protein EgtB [Prochlorococcaceae cyanobacterium ETNP14_MAG_4]|tara:strand:- start:1933 stop:3189 length:1257 start_codon:yes stop_codon:yes gene_type:complete
MAKSPIALDQPKDLLLKRLLYVRQVSEELIAPLLPEDLCLQGMPDASPPKWHLAHTNWFFETLVLKPYLASYEGSDPRWNYLFNSYYDSLGNRHPRPQRGLLTRPSIEAVMAWRNHVNKELERLLTDRNDDLNDLLELGLQHEQQHQELLLMDVLDGFSRQPLEPTYRSDWQEKWDLSMSTMSANTEGKAEWLSCEGGLVNIGVDQADTSDVNNGFHFDNEAPRHQVWLQPFQIADRLVTNREYLEFIRDGGYQRPELWMSEGWSIREQRGWLSPRYWRQETADTNWSWEFTLAGRKPLDPLAPVRHLSWFEADAYARWADAHLPTEAEWESAVETNGSQMHQLHNVLWQWTASPYRPYPGFKPVAGAVGEYNGKFMSSQFVLRGSSALTPAGHARDTYRNFFSPANRWMASGMRLAR